MPDADVPDDGNHTPQTVYEAFQAFRRAMEANEAGYRVTVRYFDRTAGRVITYEAALWGDAEEPA